MEKIKIGIKTWGSPRLRQTDGHTILENMLIGDGFHWQRVIEARLPGEITLIREKERKDDECNEGCRSSDKITLINSVPIETYLECVVASEMNGKAPEEFLKAHAVISRNWALGKIRGLHSVSSDGRKDRDDILIGWDDTSQHEGFHVCSDDHCQRYQGLQDLSPQASRAIMETANEILEDSSGRLIDTRFSKCCGGKTELFSTCWQSFEIPGIQSFHDPWCDLSHLTPAMRNRILRSILKDYDLKTENYGYRWQTEVTKKEIRENLKKYFSKDIGEILSLEVVHRGPSGRADRISLQGTMSSLILGKELWIRRLLSPTHLYSSAFEPEDLGEKIVLRGKGWGHGAGLCQIGAANMALHGHTYQEILSFYYPGSRLVRK